MYRAGRELSGPAEAEFWSLMDRYAGRVNRISWKQELRLMMRAGEFEKAYLFALQADHEQRMDDAELARAEMRGEPGAASTPDTPKREGWKKFEE